MTDKQLEIVKVQNDNLDFEFFSNMLERVIYHNLNISAEKAYGEKGLVIAINAKWGMGKTTFLQWFCERIKSPIANSNREPNTIYSHAIEKHGHDFYPKYSMKLQKEFKKIIILQYNAWENDTFSDPFTSLIGQISWQLDEENKNAAEIQNFPSENTVNPEKIKTLKNKAGKIVKAVATIGINAYLEETSSGKVFKRLGSEIIALNNELNEKLFDEQIKAYENLKESKIQFIEALENLKYGENDTIKLIIIDELDRCNPLFAVKILELIKHYFKAKHCVFLIAIDKFQLTSIVKKVYGQTFDGEHYLSRFFDFEFQLPIADNFFKKIQEKSLSNKKNNELPTTIRHSEIVIDLLEKLDFSTRERIKIISYLKLLKEIPIYDRPEIYLLMPLKFLNLERLNKAINFRPTILSNDHIEIEFSKLAEIFNLRNKYIDDTAEISTTDRALWLYFIGCAIQKNEENVIEIFKNYANQIKNRNLSEVIAKEISSTLSKQQFLEMSKIVLSICI